MLTWIFYSDIMSRLTYLIFGALLFPCWVAAQHGPARADSITENILLREVVVTRKLVITAAIYIWFKKKGWL